MVLRPRVGALFLAWAILLAGQAQAGQTRQLGNRGIEPQAAPAPLDVALKAAEQAYKAQEWEKVITALQPFEDNESARVQDLLGASYLEIGSRIGLGADDRPKKVELLSKAFTHAAASAAKGYLPAYMTLGIYYAIGRSDFFQSMKWQCRAALADPTQVHSPDEREAIAVARSRFGEITYHTGVTGADQAAAYAWQVFATEAYPWTHAIELVTYFETKLTPAELATGRGMVEQLRRGQELGCAPYAAGSSAGTLTGGSSSSASKAIDEIEQGAHSQLPLAEANGSSGQGGTTLSIKNNTAYNLTIYLSGPLDQTITLTPGGSQQLTLVGGQYRMAAKISSPGVLPFYGEQSFAAGEYSENFYISTR